jgi:hypothetical protein
MAAGLKPGEWVYIVSDSFGWANGGIGKTIERVDKEWYVQVLIDGVLSHHWVPPRSLRRIRPRQDFEAAYMIAELSR